MSEPMTEAELAEMNGLADHMFAQGQISVQAAAVFDMLLDEALWLRSENARLRTVTQRTYTLLDKLGFAYEGEAQAELMDALKAALGGEK